jgi:hypothetical protein
VLRVPLAVVGRAPDFAVDGFDVRDVGFGAAVERVFVDVHLVDLDVDRRALDFPSPIGSASPTALIAPPATSPTVPTILPAALPTVCITLGAIGECLQ